jgi:hypothetical protein
MEVGALRRVRETPFDKLRDFVRGAETAEDSGTS